MIAHFTTFCIFMRKGLAVSKITATKLAEYACTNYLQTYALSK